MSVFVVKSIMSCGDQSHGIWSCYGSTNHTCILIKFPVVLQHFSLHHNTGLGPDLQVIVCTLRLHHAAQQRVETHVKESTHCTWPKQVKSHNYYSQHSQSSQDFWPDVPLLLSLCWIYIVLATLMCNVCPQQPASHMSVRAGTQCITHKIWAGSDESGLPLPETSWKRDGRWSRLTPSDSDSLCWCVDPLCTTLCTSIHKQLLLPELNLLLTSIWRVGEKNRHVLYKFINSEFTHIAPKRFARCCLVLRSVFQLAVCTADILMSKRSTDVWQLQVEFSMIVCLACEPDIQQAHQAVLILISGGVLCLWDSGHGSHW